MKFENNKIVSDDNVIKRYIKNNKFLYKKILDFKYKKNKKIIDKIRIGNIAMFHNGRVGSTVLSDLLNQHPKIQWDGELYVKRGIFFKHFKDIPIEFLKLKIYQQKTQYYGFEIKAMNNQHLAKDRLNMSFNDFLNTLNNLNFNFFINIERKNYLRQYISLQKARLKSIKHTNKKIKPEKIFIDVNNTVINRTNDTLINNFKKIDNHYENIKNNLKDKKTLFLTYEKDILPNPKIAYSKICNFLKIKKQNPKVNLKRTNPFAVYESVENIEDVKNHLKNSDYEWMIFD